VTVNDEIVVAPVDRTENSGLVASGTLILVPVIDPPVIVMFDADTAPAAVTENFALVPVLEVAPANIAVVPVDRPTNDDPDPA
jgi:hypothetical protein